MLYKIRLTALNSKNFAWYFCGMGISLCGSWLQYVALGWLIYHLSHSATLLGLNSVVGGLPLLILSPFFGSLIDVIDKRKLLIATQTLFFIQTFTLSILAITHEITYSLILFFSLLNGIVTAIDQPLRQALIPALIDNKDDMPNAIAWNAFANNFARILGSALAGLLIYAWGEGVCFLIDSLTFLIMIFAIFQINWKKIILIPNNKPYWKTWQVGMGYIKDSCLITQSLLLTLITSTTLGTYTLLMPVIAEHIYHGNSKILGYLLASSGAGAVTASLLLTQKALQLEKIIYRTIMSSICAAIALFILIAAGRMPIGIISSALLGGSIITTIVSLNIIVQLTADDAKRGMIMGFFATAYLGAIPLSNLFASWLTNQLGIKATMNILSAIFCMGIMYFYLNVRTQFKAVMDTT